MTPSNSLQLDFKPRQCPTTVLTQQFRFCHIATSDATTTTSSWTVLTQGLFYTNVPLTNGSRQITAMNGTRTQWNGDGTKSVLSIVGPDLTGNVLNYITVGYPMFDWTGGFSYSLNDSLILPGTSINTTSITWLRDPVVEAATGYLPPNYTTSYSSFVWQPLASGALDCLPPTTTATLAQSGIQGTSAAQPASTNHIALAGTGQYSFSYQVQPHPQTAFDESLGVTWSACASGLLTLSGPTAMATATGTEWVYQISAVSGERVFIDVDGSTFITQVQGVVSNTVVQSDPSLTSAAPHVSPLGVVLVMSEAVQTAGGSSGSVYVKLYSASGNGSTNSSSVNSSSAVMREGVAGSLTPIPTTVVQFDFAPYDPAVGVYTCVRPGQSLSLGSVPGGYVVLAMVLALLALTAALAFLSRVGGHIRSRRPATAVVCLTGTAIFMGVGYVWVEYFLLFAQINIPCEGATCDSAFPYNVQLSWQVAALALLPSFLFTFTAVLAWTMAQPRGGRVSVRPSRSSITSSSKSDSGSSIHTSALDIAILSEADQIRLNLSWSAVKEHFASIALSMRLGVSPRMAVVVTSLAAALMLTRVTMGYALVTNATISFSPAAECLSALLVWVLTWPALLLLLAGRSVERVLGSALLVVIVVVDFFIVMSTASASFSPSRPSTLDSQHALLYSASLLLSPNGVSVISGAVGFLCLCVYGTMQWRALRAWRRALAKAAKASKAKADSLGQKVAVQSQQIAFLTAMGSEAAYQLDLIRTLRSSGVATTKANASKKGGSDNAIADASTPVLFALGNSDLVSALLTPSLSVHHRKRHAQSIIQTPTSGPPKTLLDRGSSVISAAKKGSISLAKGIPLLPASGSGDSPTAITAALFSTDGARHSGDAIPTTGAPSASLPTVLVPAEWRQRRQREEALIKRVDEVYKKARSKAFSSVSDYLSTAVTLPPQMWNTAANADSNRLLSYIDEAVEGNERTEGEPQRRGSVMGAADPPLYRATLSDVLVHPVACELFKDVLVGVLLCGEFTVPLSSEDLQGAAAQETATGVWGLDSTGVHRRQQRQSSESQQCHAQCPTEAAVILHVQPLH